MINRLSQKIEKQGYCVKSEKSLGHATNLVTGPHTHKQVFVDPGDAPYSL